MCFAITISGSIKIYAGDVKITREINCSGEIIVEGGRLTVATVNMTGATNLMNAVTVSNGASFVVGTALNISGSYTSNVSFSNTTVFIRKLTSTLARGSGISCIGACVHVGSVSIDSVPTKYSVSYGGRIYVGSQTVAQE